MIVKSKYATAVTTLILALKRRASFSSSEKLNQNQSHFVRVVYKSRQAAKFAGFSARFRRLLSLLHKSRYVEEMMFYRLLFTKLRLLKNLKKTLFVSVVCPAL